jgi:predicted protein tyrosine phosphatase
MIKQIEYMSKSLAEKIVPDNSMALISIRDKGYETNLKNGWNNILVLEFDDIEGDFFDKNSFVGNLLNFNLFSEEDANNIIKFIESLPNEVEILYIHCFLGRSRSPAIAKVICEKLGIEFKTKENIKPNNFVYETLKNKWN